MYRWPSDGAHTKFKICIDPDGSDTTLAWRDSGLTVRVGQVLHTLAPLMLLADAEQVFTLTSTVLTTDSQVYLRVLGGWEDSGWVVDVVAAVPRAITTVAENLPTISNPVLAADAKIYLTSAICKVSQESTCGMDANDGASTAMDTDPAVHVGTSTSWLFSVTGLGLEAGQAYKICIDPDGDGHDNQPWRDTGLHVQLQVLVTAVSPTYFSPQAAQTLTLTSDTLTVHSTMYLTSAACDDDITNTIGLHAAVAGVDSVQYNIAGANPSWTVAGIDASVLPGATYKVCVNQNQGSWWKDTAISMSIISVAPKHLPAAAGQTLTLHTELFTGTPPRAYMTTGTCDTAVYDGVHAASINTDTADADMAGASPAWMVTFDLSARLLAGTYTVCIDRDGEEAGSAWEDLGMAVQVQTDLTASLRSSIPAVANQKLNLASTTFTSSSTVYLTSQVQCASNTDGTHDASGSTDTAAEAMAALEPGLWEITVDASSLAQNVYAICIHPSNQPNLAWEDSGITVSVQADISALTPTVIGATAAQALTLTAGTWESSSTARVYITALSTSCDASTNDGSHVPAADGYTDTIASAVNTGASVHLKVVAVDTTMLVARGYRVCVDMDGTASARSWEDTGFILQVTSTSTRAIAQQAAQAITILSAYMNVGARAYLTRHADGCEIFTNNGVHSPASDTTTAAADLVPVPNETDAWVVTLDASAGPTTQCLQPAPSEDCTMYKLCFDADGAESHHSWEDAGVEVQLVDVLESVTPGAVDALASQTITLTSSGASVASVVYLALDACDDSSSGTHTALGAIDTAHAGLSGGGPFTATLDMTDLDARMYKLCIDFDGATSDQQFMDTGFALAVQTLTPKAIAPAANQQITIESHRLTGAPPRAYLASGDCNTGDGSGAHAAEVDTDTAAIDLVAGAGTEWLMVVDASSGLASDTYKVCVDNDGLSMAEFFVDSLFTVYLQVEVTATSPVALLAATAPEFTPTSTDALASSKLYLTSASCASGVDNGAHTPIADGDGIYDDTGVNAASPTGPAPTWVFCA